MNKRQIICPVGAMLLVALAFAFMHAYKQSREDTLAAASLAVDAITKHTDFDIIADPGPALKSNLLQFLAVPVS
jgi:hypothetical protein